MRARVTIALVAAASLVGAGCTSSPAPVVDDRTLTTTSAPATSVETPNAVVVAVDGLGTGLNPHLLSDLSPVSQAVGALVLPSVFRPDDDGALVMDDTLVSSAVVTGTEPFTVTYVLRDAAQWSDGAPIAAEDFRYLWEQMTSAPGAVDPAGYQLIDDVRSSGGGKTVTVTFTRPYPAWRTLFTELLPSHTLKDAPGGFVTALDDTVTFSGSRYIVRSVDRERGEVMMQRNDRFWGPPAELDEILLRRDGTSAQLAESLRTDDAQLAVVRAGAATRAQIRAVPGLAVSQVSLPSVMQVAVDTADPRLSDAGLRRGLLGLLDPVTLTTVGTTLEASTDESVPFARAQVLAPSQPGYAATAPAALTRADADTLLEEAGWTRADGRFSDADGPVTMAVGVDRADPTAIAVAQAAADELTDAGVTATATPLPADQLYGEALASGTVDLIVGRAAVGSDVATTLASRFGCPTRAASRASSTVTPSRTPPATSPSTDTGTVPATPSTATPSTATPAPTGPPRAGNVSGVCDPQIQAPIVAALSGERDGAQVAAELEAQLWQLGAVLPLYQDSVLVAARPNLRGLQLPGPLAAGPLAGAATWSRSVG